MAKHFASLGRKVLLVDADLRNPSLHQKLKGDNDCGLSNYLTGACTPPQVMQKTDIANLAFMASGPLPPNAADLLGGPRLLSLLSIGCEVFDLILIDGPPVLGLADAQLLSSAASATVFVVAAGSAKTGVIRGALKRLQLSRANLIGAVLTKYEANESGLRIRLWRGTRISLRVRRIRSQGRAACRRSADTPFGRDPEKIAQDCKHMTNNSIVWMALDLWQSPSSVKRLRAAPLPADISTLLQIVAGDEEVSTKASEATRRSPKSISEAAAFYIEQILLHPDADHYRVLGAHPDASAAELRRNMALLIRWLHPDQQNGAERSVFVARVTRAWSELKTEERRAAYDLSRRRASGKVERHKKARRAAALCRGHLPHRGTPPFSRKRVSIQAHHPGILMRVLLTLFGRALH